MNKLLTVNLTSISSIEKGWKIIARLQEATRLWPPPNEFVLVLPKPDKMEVWSWSPQRPNDLKLLRQIIDDFMKGK